MNEVKASLRMNIPDEWNRITETIIGAAMEVHSALGPGLLERLYEHAFLHELSLRGLAAQRQVPIRLKYKQLELGDQWLDLVIEDLVVVELKSVERVSDVHLLQLLSYMRSGGMPLGLLINFNSAHLRDGIFRRINTHSSKATFRPVSPQIPSAVL